MLEAITRLRSEIAAALESSRRQPTPAATRKPLLALG
jgi:hypothetical protein